MCLDFNNTLFLENPLLIVTLILTVYANIYFSVTTSI